MVVGIGDGSDGGGILGDPGNGGNGPCVINNNRRDDSDDRSKREFLSCKFVKCQHNCIHRI